MVRTVQFQPINLRGRVTNGASIEFLYVEVPTGAFRASFAAVRYALGGEEQRYGLRLDMDKRVFLDHFEDDAEKERVLAAAAPQIIEVVHEAVSSEARQPPPAAAAAAESSAAAAEPEEKKGYGFLFRPDDPLRHEPRRQVFISCSSRDIEWGDMFQSYLKGHLGQHARARRVSLWDDSRISRGDDWMYRCRQELETSKVIILLVSENFANSEFGAGNEFNSMLQEARREGAAIVHVMIERPQKTEWKIDLPGVATPAPPLKYLPEREQEQVLDEVTQFVQNWLEK